jgi:hypothetical protein
VPVNLIHRAHNTFPIPHDGEAPVIGAHGAGIDPSFAEMMQSVSQLRRRGLPTASWQCDKFYQYTVQHSRFGHKVDVNFIRRIRAADVPDLIRADRVP